MIEKDEERQMLCILTRERVLHAMLASQNHIFQCFYIFFRHKQKKVQEKREKYTKSGSTIVLLLLLIADGNPKAPYF